ncbi:MAG: hypothetical protein M3321_12985 [Actinomycetota bacterium]|nr:hypothetical protein [Actinomycetota bacterium]
MTKQRSEADILRDLIHGFIAPYRGKPNVEKAKRDALRYGLVPPPD